MPWIPLLLLSDSVKHRDEGWLRLLGSSVGDAGYSIATDPNGNSYVTGYTAGDPDDENRNNGSEDIFVAKYDADGNKQWTRLLGTSESDNGQGIAVDSSGNSYITGYTGGDLEGETNAGHDDIFVAKYDTDGNREWTRQFGTSHYDYGMGIAVDSNGNSYLTGYTQEQNQWGDIVEEDIVLAKYDANGTEQWSITFGTPELDAGHGIAVDSNGNSYITGYTRGDLNNPPDTNQGGRDVFIAKYDTAGNEQWTRLLGTGQTEVGNSITVDAKGNSYITGYTWGDLGDPPDTNQGNSDIFVAKYDAGGTKQWTRLLGTASLDSGSGIAVDPSGNSYSTGHVRGDLDGNTNAGATDIFVAKCDAGGTKQWTRLLGTTSGESGGGIALDSHGSGYITGYTSGDLGDNTNSGSDDIFIWKIVDLNR